MSYSAKHPWSFRWFDLLEGQLANWVATKPVTYGVLCATEGVLRDGRSSDAESFSLNQTCVGLKIGKELRLNGR